MLIRISPTAALPDDSGLLADAAEREGFRFIRRLIDEWSSGDNRFDRPGEAFFIARDGERLSGLCGVNVDPYVPSGETARLRHLYVDSRYSGGGKILRSMWVHPGVVFAARIHALTRVMNSRSRVSNVGMRRLLSITVAVVLIAGTWLLLFGLPPSLVLSVEELTSYNYLVSAEYFAGPAVGIAAVEPEESKALRLLAARPHGGTAFKYLLLRGTPAGRLYALVGLRHTNPRFFRVVVQPFRGWPGEVRTLFGCVGQSEKIRDVVSTRQNNPVRLKPGETLAEWWRRRSPGAEVNLDIVGGGYTSMFIDFEELTRPIN